MKKITILALTLACAFASLHAAGLDTSAISGKIGDIDTAAAFASAADLSAYRAENTTLLAQVADLADKYAALTNMVAFIEKKCESDASWRKAYHQGIAAQSVQTNEYGIVYRVDIYNDGYIYADYKGTVPRVLDPEGEERAKALIAAKREEAIAAMEKARLPEKVAELLAARRAAAQPVEKTVIVTPTLGE